MRSLVRVLGFVPLRLVLLAGLFALSAGQAVADAAREAGPANVIRSAQSGPGSDAKTWEGWTV